VNHANPIPAPRGPSAADGMRAASSPTGTEHGCPALGSYADRTGTGMQRVKVRDLDVETLITQHAASRWCTRAATTRPNYTGHALQAIADFHTALNGSVSVRAIRTRTRVPQVSGTQVPADGGRLSVELPDAEYVRLVFEDRPSRADLYSGHHRLLGNFALAAEGRQPEPSA
jgi:hypothetical protein